MSVIHRRPIGGVACLDTTWHKPYIYNAIPSAQVCPDWLLIACTTGRVVVNFAGRGWFGVSCPLTDDYVRLPIALETYQQVVSYDANSPRLVDVWKALDDGVWTSSVNIEIRVTTSGAVASDIYVHARNGTDNYVTKSITTESTFLGIGCGSVLKATVTVNDDGTFSIA